MQNKKKNFIINDIAKTIARGTRNQSSSRFENSIDMAEQYPFPADDPDFKQNPPDTPQRMWIAKSIANGRESGPNLAKRFNSSSHFMRVLVYKYKKGFGLKRRGGRPRALDELSIQKLDDITAVDDGPTIDQFRVHLNEEYGSTLSRRRPIKYMALLEKNAIRCMPRRTRKRYILKYNLETEE